MRPGDRLSEGLFLNHAVAQNVVSASTDGTAIVVISDDVPELADIADRIVVMRNGEIAAELQGPDIREERIVDELAA